MDEAARKVISFIVQQNEFDGSIQEKMDEIKDACIKQMEKLIKDAKVHQLIVENRDRIPERIRAEADELDATVGMDSTAFASGIRASVHSLLCYTDANNYHNNYRGLDSDRDTEKEVGTMLRIVPEVLEMREAERYEEEGEVYEEEGHYPITLQAMFYDSPYCYRCNIKSISFIPIMAKVAIDFGLFRGVADDEEDVRGGLLIKDQNFQNVFDNLLCPTRKDDNRDADYHRAVDEKFLGVLVRLRAMGLVKKEDISRYHLFRNMFSQSSSSLSSSFPAKRFQFLTNWDPDALRHRIAGSSIELPLHYTAKFMSIDWFRHVFEEGIRLFPMREGVNILFRFYNRGHVTAFEIACQKHGTEKVTKVIENALVDCYSDGKPFDNEAALLTAIADERISFEGVNFWLRREPDGLQKLLLSSNGGDGNDPGSSDTAKKRASKSKKRKRNRGRGAKRGTRLSPYELSDTD